MRYLVESPHTKEECLRALDETLGKGAEVLNGFEWGCAEGDHTGYAILESESEAKARNLIPGFLQKKARIVKLGKFTPEQIKSFHKAA